MGDKEYLADLVGPTCLFVALYAVFYLLVRGLRSNKRIINSKLLKRLDFVWLTVAAGGLFFAGFDLIKSDAALRGADARSEYRWHLDGLKTWLRGGPTICRLRFVKSQWSPRNFDALVQQQSADCVWARKVAAQVRSFDSATFDDLEFPTMPALPNAPIHDAAIENIFEERKALEIAHAQVVRSGWVGQNVERNADRRRIALYLLAFALAVRFAKVHGELSL
jgi:hypothetical protein